MKTPTLNGLATAPPAAEPALVFGLGARPAWPQALIAAVAHLLAIVAPIMAAPLLIARGLELAPADVAYVVSCSLLISGAATLLQVHRFGPVGSGLLAVQGTSFTFIGPLLLAGAQLGELPGGKAQMLGILLGSAAAGGVCIMVLSLQLERLQRVVTPQVAGVTIVLLGLALTATAWENLARSVAAARTAGESGAAVWAQAVTVLAVIGALALRREPWLRLASICAGLVAGLLVAALTGGLAAGPPVDVPMLATPEPLRYPLGFDWGVFLVLAPIFLVTMAESIGDLTATSMLSGLSVAGSDYWARLRRGVLADGLNTVLASLAGTFPNTTFSQNNGVIRLTGVASRQVGLLVGACLVALGLVPAVGALFQRIPGGVLHAATGLMFAMIVLSGLRILRAQPAPRRGFAMLAGCGGAALALTVLPGALMSMGVALPAYLAMLFGFPVATGALCAIGWEAWRPVRQPV